MSSETTLFSCHAVAGLLQPRQEADPLIHALGSNIMYDNAFEVEFYGFAQELRVCATPTCDFT